MGHVVNHFPTYTVSLTCLINGKLCIRLIHSVQYVPALAYVLLSCRALTWHSLIVTFEGGSCKICHEDQTLIAESSEMPNQLYFLSTMKDANNNATLTAAPSFNLVHK